MAALIIGFYVGCQIIEGIIYVRHKFSLSWGWSPYWDWQRGLTAATFLTVGAVAGHLV